MSRVSYDVGQLKRGVLAQDRLAVARALTLVESQLPAHRLLTQQLLRELPPAPPSHRIGITGPPGAGKSTLIEALGLAWIEQGQRVGVLAIDPSSQTTGGSILGDKTRMERLSQSDQAFLRPSPAGGALGGVARRTREGIAILEAAGHSRVVVETVGVGQSETAVAHLVDTVLLVALPGAGDEVQGIKRGLMENADVVFVNKADGEQAAWARAAANQLSLAVRLLSSRTAAWRPPVLTGSALTGLGLSELVKALEDHRGSLVDLDGLRGKQAVHWFRRELEDRILAEFFGSEGMRERVQGLEEEVRAARLTPDEAASRLLD